MTTTSRPTPPKSSSAIGFLAKAIGTKDQESRETLKLLLRPLVTVYSKAFEGETRIEPSADILHSAGRVVERRMSSLLKRLSAFRSGDDGNITSRFEGNQRHEDRVYESEREDDCARMSFGKGDEQGRYKDLFDHFLMMESSLQKYWNTCTAFLKVTGLVQEGIDQMTADVLTYCSELEENGKVQALENDALKIRDAMSCEEVANENVRKFLLGPMGDQLKYFQDIKARAKGVSKLKGEYYEHRRVVNKLRIDRHGDRAILKMEESNLRTLAIELESEFQNLMADLEQIYLNRAKILKDPFDALRLCQAEFLQHVSGVLRGDLCEDSKRDEDQREERQQQHDKFNSRKDTVAHTWEQTNNRINSGAWENTMKQQPQDKHRSQANYQQPYQQQQQQQHYSGRYLASKQKNAELSNNNTNYNIQSTWKTNRQHSGVATNHAAEHHHNAYHAHTDEESGNQGQYEHQEETETVMSMGTAGIGQRHVVAKIVKDFHALKGRRIFERPPQFKALSVAQHSQQHQLHAHSYVQQTAEAQPQNKTWEGPSTYRRVEQFCRTVLQQTGRSTKKGRTAEIREQAAAITLQGFWRIMTSQNEARRLASQIVSVNIDPNTGYPFYSNPHSGYMSWHPTLFSPRDQ